MPDPALIVTYLLDRYVPSGAATIDYAELRQLEDEGKDYVLEMNSDSFCVKLVTQRGKQ